MGQFPSVPFEVITELTECIDAFFDLIGIEKTRDTVKSFLLGRAAKNGWRNQVRNTAAIMEKDPQWLNSIEILVDAVMGMGDIESL